MLLILSREVSQDQTPNPTELEIRIQLIVSVLISHNIPLDSLTAGALSEISQEITERLGARVEGLNLSRTSRTSKPGTERVQGD